MVISNPGSETGSVQKLAKKVFLTRKPAPVYESKFANRQEYQLGSLSHFINAKVGLSVCLSVRDAMGEMCFSAVIEDRQLKFLVKVPITYEHLFNTLFCPSVCPSLTLWVNVCLGCYI